MVRSDNFMYILFLPFTLRGLKKLTAFLFNPFWL